jgi:hypothetical protein
MKNKNSYILIFIFFLVSCNIFEGEKTLAKLKFEIDSLEPKITFEINETNMGEYAISFFLEPKNINALRQFHEPSFFQFSVKIQQGNKTIEKDLSYILEGAATGQKIKLYSIPGDFSIRGGVIHITINDIRHDNNFLLYYEQILFSISRFSFFR